jgi:hypothetical protein
MSATIDAVDQPTQALQVANAKRIAMAALRRRLRTERGALADVMLNPPAVLENVAIVDVVRLAYSKRSGRMMQLLGREACRDNVNLLMPLGCASLRTRRWVAEHAGSHWR